MAQQFVIAGAGSSWDYSVIEEDGSTSFTSDTLATRESAVDEMFLYFGAVENTNWFQVYRQDTAPDPVPETFALWEDTSVDPTQLYAAMNSPGAVRYWQQLSVLYEDPEDPGTAYLLVTAGTGGVNNTAAVQFFLADGTYGYATLYGSPTDTTMSLSAGASAELRLETTSTHSTATLFAETLTKAGLASSALVRVGGTLAQSSTQVGNTAATETSLWSYSIPASTLGTDGDHLDLWAAGTFPVLATPVTILLKFSGTTALSKAVAAAQGTAGNWHLNCRIMRTGATTQLIEGILVTVSATGVVLNFPFYATAAETLSGAITIDVRGNGTNASDVVFKLGKLLWSPGNT